jgi:hypothetical protein
MGKFVFQQDYDANGANIVANGQQGASTLLKYSFKKGDIFDGERIIISAGVAMDSPAQYAINITTPTALNLDGTNYNGQGVFSIPDNIVINQSLLPTQVTQSFVQKHKTHLLIAGALVLGYFAYKKFNK